MSDERGRTRELLELIATALVDAPDRVRVTETRDERGALYELEVSAADLGKVIGKQGRTARAIRTILASSGAKLGQRLDFEILE